METEKANELEIKLKFNNYKLLKDNEFNFSGSYLYLIKGPNDTGKTSLMHSLISIMTAKDLTPNPITNGEEFSSIQGSIPGPEGNYGIRMDIAKDKRPTFLIFKPNGEKVKKVTDIRAIFEYNGTTIDDFIRQSYTPDGRRKQMKILSNLLSPKNQIEFNNLRTSTTSGGTLFEDRKAKNAILVNKEALLETYKVTPEEEAFYMENINANSKLEKAKEETITLVKIPTKEVNINLINNSYDPRINNLESTIDNDIIIQNQDNNRIIQINKQLEMLNQELSDIKSRNKDQRISDNRKALNKLIDDKAKDIASVKDDTDLQNDLIKNKQLVEELTYKVNEVNRIKTKSDEQVIKDEELTIAENEAAKSEESLSNGRNRINELISSINIPGYDISIKNEAIHINDFILDETQVSDSKMTIAITAILAKANKKSKILCIGKLAELDNNSRQQLVNIAKENNLIIVGDDVDDNYDDIYVKGYQDTPIDPSIIKEENDKKIEEINTIRKISSEL